MMLVRRRRRYIYGDIIKYYKINIIKCSIAKDLMRIIVLSAIYFVKTVERLIRVAGL